MDLNHILIMEEADHLQYPLNCASIEQDILNQQLLFGDFESQHSHPSARLPHNTAFNVDLFPHNGRPETFQLAYGMLIAFFQNRLELNELPFKFFFMYQPGSRNRIWMPCMQILFSILKINPSFPYLVGKPHVSSFGSYTRTEDDGTPHIYETWWSICCQKVWPKNNRGLLSLDDGQRSLFDIMHYENNDWAICTWRPSICLQYNLKHKTSTVVVLDEGFSFRDGRFKDAMDDRERLGMHMDPFSIHVLFLSEVMNDWTFSFEVLEREIRKEQQRVFQKKVRREDYEKMSTYLHDVTAHQLKYQNHITSMPRVLEAVKNAHKRFKDMVGIPDHVFQRVEDLLDRLILQAQSNHDHCISVLEQTKNIQRQLIDLTNLEIESNIRKNTETYYRVIRGLEQILARRNQDASEG